MIEIEVAKVEEVARYLQENRERHLQELMQFLRIPSVSALSDHDHDCLRAAQWVADRLRAAGVPDVRVVATPGKPVVYAHWPAAENAGTAPTVIIYAHYDVQPVDPVDRWTSPPFDPEIRDGRIYARGASDDKGNLLIPILAVEALAAVGGRLPLNIKFLFEGEEEIGSPSLPQFLTEHRDLVQADLVLCADGGMWSTDIPSLTVGSRGIAALQIDVKSARTDLHSGMHGGVVQNPIHALVRILSGMRDAAGRITVPGFYDGVRELTETERRQLAAVPFSEEEYRQELGVPDFAGEPGYTILERLWTRPTLEVNGIWGGFQGEGTKTVIPAEAHAKITCRLVPDQDPDDVLDKLEAFIRSNAPVGCTVSVQRFSGSAHPYLMPYDHPSLRVAAEVLVEQYGREPVVVRMGGTVPVAEMFRSLLGIWFVYFSFGEPDNNLHAPDEFLRLQSFDRGIRSWARLLQRLAGLDPAELRPQDGLR